VTDILYPLETVHPDDRKRVDGVMGKLLCGELDHMEHEFRILRKHGRVVTIKVFGGTMIYRGRAAAINTVIDITRERTLDAQLMQSRKMEAVGMPAGGVAHDFNNILTAITGYGTLLQMKLGKEDPLNVHAGHILSSSGKGANLTRSLLAFSRQQPLAFKPVSINGLLGETSKLLNRLLTEDVALTIIPCEEDIIVMADATQLDQILLNLTANARNAMPEGGALAIETKLVEMDDKTMERIFEPFFTTKEAGKGTGLGLSTIYGIVKQRGGSLAVQSRQGMGTAFLIYFPHGGSAGLPRSAG
jgi:signal transduction histidine kinase